MFPYMLAYFTPAAFALVESTKSRPPKLFLHTFLVLLVVLIGYRFGVGCDWPTYQHHLAMAKGFGLKDLLAHGDYAHWAVYTITAQWEMGIYPANLLYAAIFCYGLKRLAASTSNPWLAIAVAIPYLVTVVAMGYSRQACAIGILMVAFSQIRDISLLRYTLFVFVAALFHSSAVIMMPLALYLGKTSVGHKFSALLFLGVFGFIFILENSQADRIVTQYIDKSMASSGGLIRVLMNAITGVLVLLYRRKWQLYFGDYVFWRMLAIMALVSVPMVFQWSTAIDRIGLYLLVLQPVVFSRLSLLVFGRNQSSLIVIGVLSLLLAVHLVWLNFGVHAALCWIPYKNWLSY